MLKALMEKVDNIQKQMMNENREENSKKELKEMLETKSSMTKEECL